MDETELRRLMEDSDLYSRLCDLFYQAIIMGQTEEFDRQPDTDALRIRNTSPQSRQFANAALRVVSEAASS